MCTTSGIAILMIQGPSLGVVCIVVKKQLCVFGSPQQRVLILQIALNEGTWPGKNWEPEGEKHAVFT